VVASVAAAAAGALILGEYQLSGATPVVGGLLFGLVVGEVAMAAAGRRPGGYPRWLAAVVAGSAGGGALWAVWISSGRDWSFVPGPAWAGVALAALAGGLWVRGLRRRGAGSPPAP